MNKNKVVDTVFFKLRENKFGEYDRQIVQIASLTKNMKLLKSQIQVGTLPDVVDTKLKDIKHPFAKLYHKWDDYYQVYIFDSLKSAKDFK